jgi:hypothetical protein
MERIQTVEQRRVKGSILDPGKKGRTRSRDHADRTTSALIGTSFPLQSICEECVELGLPFPRHQVDGIEEQRPSLRVLDGHAHAQMGAATSLGDPARPGHEWATLKAAEFVYGSSDAASSRVVPISDQNGN